MGRPLYNTYGWSTALLSASAWCFQLKSNVEDADLLAVLDGHALLVVHLEGQPHARPQAGAEHHAGQPALPQKLLHTQLLRAPECRTMLDSG